MEIAEGTRPATLHIPKSLSGAFVAASPNTHCAARTARAYRVSSLFSAVMNAGKVAAANGLLPRDLMGRPPLMMGRPLSARASSEACTKVHAHAQARHT